MPNMQPEDHLLNNHGIFVDQVLSFFGNNYKQIVHLIYY
jgi:hypothetical protein